MNTMDFFLALSRLLDLAHPNLSDHQIKTAYISWQLGEVLGLDEDQMHNLIMAALIHDIGAIVLEEDEGIHDTFFEDKEDTYHGERAWFIVSKNLNNVEMADAIRFHHTDYSVLGDKNFLSQIIHLADSIERKIDKKIDIFMQSAYVRECVLKGKETEFHPEIVKAYFILEKRESFWFTLENPNLKTLFAKAPIKKEPIDNIYKYSRLVRDILDFRSPYTVRHSTGVMVCAKLISESLEFDSEAVKKITLAGLLHDVGKLVVPDKILLKNGKLNSREVFNIRKHAYYTHAFLEDAQFDSDICKWASYHHERADGSGYPFRLNSEKIPFESKIISFSDIFVALIEDRPYRAGLDKDKVEKIMRSLIVDSDDKLIIDTIFEKYQMLFCFIRDKYVEIGKEYQNLLLI